VEDLGCLVHMPGPNGESWKLYLELAADYGRNSELTDGPILTSGWRELHFDVYRVIRSSNISFDLVANAKVLQVQPLPFLCGQERAQE